MSTAETPHDAIVVGAGLAGLAAAFRLKMRGFQKVVVLEAGDRAGGCVRTIRRDGRLFETGPNSLRGHCPSIASLARAVGVFDTRLPASKAASERWIWLDDKRQRVPGGPRDLLTSTCLSPRGRLRLLAEPTRPRWRTPVNATTIAAFMRDRLGDEAFEAFAAPMTTGIFAGEPENIGVEAFQPFELAAAAGGLVRGMGRIRAIGSGSELWTFNDGLETLVHALAARLDVRTGHRVAAVHRDGAHHVVRLDDGTCLNAARVVVATPAHITATILDAPFLAQVPCASVATVGLALRTSDFVSPPTGFGMLVSRRTPLEPVLGIVFASRIFAGRAGSDEVLVSLICGGMRHPSALRQDDASLVDASIQALTRAFGFRGTPLDAVVTRWSNAIPQVPPGHRERVEVWLGTLSPGLAVAGNGLGGVSLEQVATSGLAAADRVTDLPTV